MSMTNLEAKVKACLVTEVNFTEGYQEGMGMSEKLCPYFSGEVEGATPT
jgi:hypothetical protein